MVKVGGAQLLVGDVFANAAGAVPDQAAVVLGDRRLTFADVQRQADAVVARVTELGLGRGDRVAGWFGTDTDAVALFVGLARAGLVFSPINPLLSSDETAEILTALRPDMIVHDAERATAAADLATTMGVPDRALADIVATDGPTTPRTAPVLAETDPHVVFFTSGSSGRPKGVVLSHRVGVLRSHPGALLEPRGPAVCAFPLFHMAAWTIGLQQWHARGALVLVEQADAATLLRAIAASRAERINCVPAVWRRILDELARPDAADYDTSSLTFADTGTSATPPELLDDIGRAFPQATVRVFYGSTEAGNVASMAGSELAAKPGRCGTPSPLTDVRIEDGELQVRGPLVFDAYDDVEQTVGAFDRAWYRTGDRAEIDADGYLSIVGRVGDLIRTGGESVSPDEVEVVLARHPAIDDCAVVGIPSPDWGEVVCAAIVTASGRPPSVEDLRAHCEGSLAGFKHPRMVAVVERIPRTEATGKVQQPLLIDQITGTL